MDQLCNWQLALLPHLTLPSYQGPCALLACVLGGMCPGGISWEAIEQSLRARKAIKANGLGPSFGFSIKSRLLLCHEMVS